jgi:hypothetical protein
MSTGPEVGLEIVAVFESGLLNVLYDHPYYYFQNELQENWSGFGD